MTARGSARGAEPVQVAVGIPNVGVFGDPRVLVELAVMADESGWDGFFVWDHLLYSQRDWPVADPIVTLGAVAARTQRLQLGCLCIALPRRRPGKLAKELATLDVLSSGRLIVGVGLGSMPQEYTSFGETADLAIRAAKLDEGLDVIAGLWSGQSTSYHGRHVQIENVAMTPVPVQRPRPKIWCAGRWPAKAPFRRAARYDGVMPTHAAYGHGETMPAATVSEIVEYVGARRIADAPFDVAIEGRTDGPADPALLADYAEAGCTWWIEALGWWRGDINDAKRRIAAGPR